jgi:DNA polymerase-3 subunit epsilon
MRLFRRTHAPPDFVRAYLDAPRPNADVSWRAAPYTVLDVETSGLAPRSDALLAIGLVDIDAGRVLVERSWHTLIHPPDGLVVPGESIRIHGLLHGDLAQAPPLTEVLPELLRRLSGRVLVVHVAAIDIGFLNRALRQCYGAALRGPAIDTARLAAHLRRQERFIRGHTAAPSTLALSSLAEEANLPIFSEHNALNDALTTAQLFLAQATRLEQLGARTLGKLLRTGGCIR